MRPVALLIFLCLAACGGDPAEDDSTETPAAMADEAACSVPTGGIKVNGGVPDESSTFLDCTGGELSCEGATVLKQRSCDDGFAVTLERGDATLMLRLKGADSWTAGARINGKAFTGSMTMSGLYPQSKPVPAAGTKQRASFSMNSDEAIANGTFSIEW